jgi:SAM-dependent methyltransferase
MKSDPQDKAEPGSEKPLARMVSWSHRFLAEVLRPGDLALDLTAGTGRDTLFLFRCLGPRGRVVAFDIQREALLRTESLLAGAGARVFFRSSSGSPAPFSSGVHLIHESHSELSRYLAESPRGIVANLGFLPGGDPQVRTRTESTLEVLEQSLGLLEPGGRMVVTVYTGHPGGAEESAAVEALLGNLPTRDWQALKLQVANCREAPFLVVAEKRLGKRTSAVD